MSQFVVSARKYRPTCFKDVLSQPHITTALKQAVVQKKLAHALLFCGPRGVGKTTCARILAKTLNCLALTDQHEACGSCAHCVRFHTQGLMNIHELDAASNNSVDDIRELVEQVRYAPEVGHIKIYIIDEVHMLSNAAFNAFLKTLEEPPHHVIFILATTERNKILPTILSRCQIFYFNAIQPCHILAQLKQIAQHENIDYQTDALQLIAQKAGGAMRDALSMFDLMTISVESGEKITYTMAAEHLQILDENLYFQCTTACLAGQVGGALTLYDLVLRKGFQGHDFLVGLGMHFRNLLVCLDPKTLPLLEVTDHVRSRYSEYAEKCSLSFLLQALKLVSQSALGYKSSQNQRLHVELLLMELASLCLPTTTGRTAHLIQPSTGTLPKLDDLKISCRAENGSSVTAKESVKKIWAACQSMNPLNKTKKPYTDQEKLAHCMDRNPSVALLKDLLSLGFIVTFYFVLLLG